MSVSCVNSGHIVEHLILRQTMLESAAPWPTVPVMRHGCEDDMCQHHIKYGSDSNFNGHCVVISSHQTFVIWSSLVITSLAQMSVLCRLRNFRELLQTLNEDPLLYWR